MYICLPLSLHIYICEGTQTRTYLSSHLIYNPLRQGY